MSSSNLPTRHPELLSAYIDGELTGEELRVVEAWLAEDSDARALADEMRSVSATLQALPPQELSGDWSHQLSTRLDEVAKPHDQATFNVPLGRSSRGWLYSAAAIAAAVAIMFFVPREVDNQVAVNKPAARGGELREEATEDGTDESLNEGSRIPELRGEVASDSEPEADTALADVPSNSASRMAPPEPAVPRPEAAVSSLAGRAEMADAFAEGEEANTDNFFIVWADVPPAALRDQQINLVLARNGIRLEEDSESAAATVASAPVEAAEDLATPPAAEPMLEQIAVRNYVHNVESNTLAEGGARGGFGGGGGGRNTGAAVRSRRGATAGSTNSGSAGPESGEAPALEGETILVEATAEQIASCLVDMEQDATTYRTITLEPVQQLEQLKQLADKVDESQLRELAKEDYGLWRFYQQQGIADRDQRGAKVASARALETRQGYADELSQSSGQSNQAFANQMAGQSVAQAQRLKRPEQWYFYNAPPQSEQNAYRLRAAEPESKSKGAVVRGANEMKQQLAQLKVQRQQPVGAARASITAEDLPDRTPLQVLFVLRSTDLAASNSAPQP